MQAKAKKKLSLYDLIENVKGRPGMYLGSATFDSLRAFLSGISCAQHVTDEVQNSEPPFGEFDSWLGIHHHMATGGGGWYGALKHQSSDDKQAFDSFFELIAAYRQRTLKFQYQFALTSAQRRLYATAQNSLTPYQLRLSQYKGERCLFLHARWRGQRGWCLHTVFESLEQSRRWLPKVFGITQAQWRKVTKDAV